MCSEENHTEITMCWKRINVKSIEVLSVYIILKRFVIHFRKACKGSLLSLFLIAKRIITHREAVGYGLLWISTRKGYFRFLS